MLFRSAITDAIPDVPAVIFGDRHYSWREYDQRAARFASALTAAGLGPDDKVGLYLYNSNEYLEAHYGAFKQRVVPINVNFRYLGSEMQYLLDNADCRALVYHASLADRVAEIAGNLPLLTLLVEVDDGPASAHVEGHVRYEDVIASHEPAPRIEHSPDDVYMLYTGGTTGMPKGVMYKLGEMTATFLGNGFNAQKMPVPTNLEAAVAQIVEQRAAEGTYVAAPCCQIGRAHV